MSRSSKCYIVRGIVGLVVGAVVGAIGGATIGAQHGTSIVGCAVMISIGGFLFAGETALAKIHEQDRLR